jgi:hypothetical protein
MRALRICWRSYDAKAEQGKCIETGLDGEIKSLMKELINDKAVAVIEPLKTDENSNGHHHVDPAAEVPAANFVTNEHLIAEERSLIAKEADVEKRYAGLRGWFRIAHVSAVIGKLALYLYLDQ